MNITEYMETLTDPNEKPLDNLVSDGGFCGILRTIGCVGDSLSSGEFETLDENGVHHYYDIFDYSWGQFMARMAGITVYNFSRGGMSAKQYMESFAEEKDFWNPEKKCKAYIIALGVNDLLNNHDPLGSLEDICHEDYRLNKHTFAGYYAMIVQKLKTIAPDAKFFFMTMPDEHNRKELQALKDAHASLMYDLAEYFSNAYVIDFRKYAPVYDEAFKEKFYLNGHLNACGYLLTAKMTVSYIDYIIRHHFEDFKEIGLVNTPWRNFKRVTPAESCSPI